MRYSTTPRRDRRRIVIWVLVGSAGVYLLLGILPMGAVQRSRVSWSPAIPAGERVALIEALARESGHDVRREGHRLYWETFFRPFAKAFYRSSASFTGGGDKVQIVTVRSSEHGSVSLGYTARRTDGIWILHQGHAVISKY
jgi:amino acid transporter